MQIKRIQSLRYLSRALRNTVTLHLSEDEREKVHVLNQIEGTLRKLPDWVSVRSAQVYFLDSRIEVAHALVDQLNALKHPPYLLVIVKTADHVRQIMLEAERVFELAGWDRPRRTSHTMVTQHGSRIVFTAREDENKEAIQGFNFAVILIGS